MRKLCKDRTEIRENAESTYVANSGDELFGLNQNNVVGWMSNKYNPAAGWSLHELSEEEKSEFATDDNLFFRTYSDSTESTAIIRINITTGKYSFIDNEFYIEGHVVYDRPENYKMLCIDCGKESFFELI